MPTVSRVAAVTPGSSPSQRLPTGDDLGSGGLDLDFGPNNAALDGGVTTELPSGVAKHWARIRQLDVNDGGTTGGQVTLTFDISEAGGTSGSFGVPGDYLLLKRATGSTDAFTIVTVVGSPSVSGDRLTFTVAVSELGSEFTVGAKAGAPTAVTLSAFRATAPTFDLVAWVADLLRRLRR